MGFSRLGLRVLDLGFGVFFSKALECSLPCGVRTYEQGGKGGSDR